MVQLSIILPCYNPPSGWEQRVVAVYQSLSTQLSLRPQLIIVDDGNGTAIDAPLQYLITAIPQLQTVRYPQNKGKGYALRQGVIIATGRIILYTDIDFPYTEASMLSVYSAIATAGNDVAIGVKNESYYTKVPPLRRTISKGLRSMVKLLMRLPVNDTQCGLKAFATPAKETFLTTTIDRYLFDLEFIYRAFRREKLNVTAVPVQLNDGVVFRKMNYRILIPEFMNFLKILRKG